MRRRRNRGAALVTALATLIAVTAVGVAITSYTAATLSASRLDRARAEARLAAEGGIDAARAFLSRDPRWAGGTFRVGRHTAEVAVREGRDPTERTVLSSVRGGAVVASVEATLQFWDTLPRVRTWTER